MCYHTSFKGTANDLKEAFQAPFPSEDDLKIYYHANGFAHPELAIYAKGEIRLGQWGLIPNWKNKTLKEMLVYAKGNLNARDNTIFEKISFKNSIINKRCVIPITGFFEPHHYKGNSYPYYIAPKYDKFLYAAGIYSFWKEPISNEWLTTFSMVTTNPNTYLSKIHNEKDRMVVLLDKRNIQTWVEYDLPPEQIKELMQPCPEENLMAYSVKQGVMNSRIDTNTPDVTKQVFYEELKYDQELYNGFNLN